MCFRMSVLREPVGVVEPLQLSQPLGCFLLPCPTLTLSLRHFGARCGTKRATFQGRLSVFTRGGRCRHPLWGSSPSSLASRGYPFKHKDGFH